MTTSALPRELIGADRPRSEPIDTTVDTRLGPVRLRLYRDFEPVREPWSRLQQTALCTYGQTYAWMEAWHRIVAAPSGAELAIIVGESDARTPLFIWPFEIVRRAGQRTMRWVGQAQANYNMGLYDPGFAAGVEARDVAALLRQAAVLAGDVAAACLRDQPADWDGIDNPMRKLPHQTAPSRGFAVRLNPDFQTLFRSRFSGRSRGTLARKERRLNVLGPLSYGWGGSAAERLDLLETFLAQKSAWFDELGISDAFADPRHRAFYRCLAALDPSEPGHLRLGYLKSGDRTEATFNGIRFRGRFYVLLSSIGGGRARRWSPGKLLLLHQIREACESGLTVYDLGVGEAPHKLDWSDERIDLIDSFIAFRLSGRLVTLPLSAKAALKRVIKTNPVLWDLARSVRRTLLGRRGSAGADTV